MLTSAVILGLLGSFHCIGMCGPIAFLLPVDRSNNFRKNIQIGAYHFGRLTAYAFIGLIFGWLGRSFYLFGMQQQLSIATGIIMIVLVLAPSKWLQRFRITQPVFKGISKIKSSLGGALKKKTTDAFLTIGFLNGFLPCGLVYMAVFGALAMAQPAKGALYMVIFGLGTVPMMTLAVYLGNFINGRMRQRIRKVIPLVVVLLGTLFILRGMGLGIPYVSPKPMTPTAEASMECHTPSNAKEVTNYIPTDPQ